MLIEEERTMSAVIPTQGYMGWYYYACMAYTKLIQLEFMASSLPYHKKFVQLKNSDFRE